MKAVSDQSVSNQAASSSRAAASRVARGKPEAQGGGKENSLNPYPWYAPRFWHGMRAGHYFRLLARNHFKIHLLGLGPALAISGISCFNSLMYRLQQLTHGRRIRDCELVEAPLFIVGHWRSGTTLLHELLVQDSQFAFPTTYECFAPNHFLVTDWFVPQLCRFLLPSRRPMDNMEAGFDRPQEDEFALCVMGAPTPYLRMAFPNHAPPDEEFLDLEGVAPDDLKRFQDSLQWFFHALTVRHQKRLVLKSPPHTGRIEKLAEWFPGARFVHLARNPQAVYASTLKLWRTLDRHQGFQLPKYTEEQLSEYVLATFERMYSGYRQQLEHLPEEQCLELKFEDLVADPLPALQQIYDKFALGDFAAARPAFTRFLEQRRDYRPAEYELDPTLSDTLRRRWAWYFDRYGY